MSDLIDCPLDDLEQAIASVLYGQALGDAYGMPSELLSYAELKKLFSKIDSLLPGHPQNPASAHFKQAEITDDTQMALAICDAIIEAHGIPNSTLVAKHILHWADNYDVWDKNILGPSSSKALKALKEGTSIDELENLGTSNGCVMRIAPLGCVLPTPDISDNRSLDTYLSNIFACTSPTHKSNIALSAASAIAAFISASLDKHSPSSALQLALHVSDYAYSKEEVLFYPNISSRIKGALHLYNELINQEIKLSDLGIFCEDTVSKSEIIDVFIREYIGTTMEVSDTVPAAFVAAFACNFNASTCAQLCANLGGDTDTIGAIACALCGSQMSLDMYDDKELSLLEQTNNLEVHKKAQSLKEIRMSLCIN